jgi:hypothetical protein
MKTRFLPLSGIVLIMAAMSLADDIKVWPLFYQHSDTETRSRRTEVLWPLYVRESTPEYVANQFISFPQDYPEQYPHQFYLLWPFSGVRTGDGHDAWLFPFLWSKAEASGNDHHLALFPAFYYGEEGESTSLNLALLQHNHWGPNGSEHYLWPLFWKTTDHHNGQSGGSLGVLPLMWLNHRRTVSDSYRSSSHCGGLLLFNWWHRHSSTNLTGGVVTGARTDSSENLFPVYHRSSSSQMTDQPDRRRSSEDALWLMPYWQSHDSGTDPSGEFSKSSHTLFPIYHDWHDTRQATVRSGRLVVPLWFHSDTFVSGEKEAAADFIVPMGAHLYKRGEYETRNLLGPVFNRTANLRTGTVRYDALFPFFSLTSGDHESAGRLFPLAGWDEKEGERDNVWWLFPLGWKTESQGKIDYAAAYPELGAWRRPESHERATATDCRQGPRRTVAFYPFFWSKRQADEQSSGLLPFYWRNTYRSGRTVSRDTVIPLVLGDRETRAEDDTQTYAGRSYLLSLLAFGAGSDFRQWRMFPVFSYRRSGGSRDYSSFLLPFAYDTWRDPQHPDRTHSSELSIPFSFLPLFRTHTGHEAGATTNRESWFFPFYKRSLTETAEGRNAKLSILWPLWNGEWQNDETHIRGLGGVVNYYEKDSNDFVEQRLLYRVFSRRTRSWFSERELMPLYAQSSREDGSSSWSFLGGLLGGGSDGDRNHLRLFYFKIRTTKATPVPMTERESRERRHAALAMNYLRHGRHDRAAIEFALAGKTFENDREMQLAAAVAYLKVAPDAFGKELRSSVPSSLEFLAGGSGHNAAMMMSRLRRQALQHFENALRLGADRPTTLCLMAEAYVDLGELARALELLAESDHLQPTFATGLSRLEVGETLWRQCTSREARNEAAGKAAQVSLLSILAELKGRYPQSPTLALREAGWIGTERSLYRWSGSYLASDEAFSAETQQRLALYRQGAGWLPAAEEQAWLTGARVNQAPSSQWRDGFALEWTRLPPQVACAQNAGAILNQQLAYLISEKKHDEAAQLQQPLFELLPRTCALCAAAEEPSSVSADSALALTLMRHLYSLYVTAWKKPETYLATVEALAGKLCQHQRATLERSLDSLRLEQQYLKTWCLSGVIRGAAVERQYDGTFFERYVDLDKILGKPDQCTITAECVVRSPVEQKAVLRLGFDRTLTAEWNGQKILGPVSRKIAVRDEYAVAVVLKAGENRLRLTVTDDKLAYGFFARLSSPSGELMKDVTVVQGAE